MVVLITININVIAVECSNILLNGLSDAMGSTFGSLDESTIGVSDENVTLCIVFGIYQTAAIY
jgi:hypothetical protein